MSSKYSVGTALSKVFRRNIESTKEWAELTVSVNSTLSRLYSGEVSQYREPRIILKSHKYRDILNLIVVCLLTREENVKFLLKQQLLESPTVKENPELKLYLVSDFTLKEFLVNLVHRRGFNYLFSLINFKASKDNKQNILKYVRFTTRSLGTPRNRIPAKRRIGVGYRDKGSLPRPGASQVSIANLEPRENQLRIEQNRETKEHMFHFFEGFYE